MLDPLKIGYYLLFFIPGFIFVQIVERHLLREKKPQLEKTLEIFLWSGFIWMTAISLPCWGPFPHARTEVLDELKKSIDDAYFIKNPKKDVQKPGKDEQKATKVVPSALHAILRTGTAPIKFFFSVCFWSFLVANLWGYLRKLRYFDTIIKWFTGRDWYPSVSFRFFNEYLNKAVQVEVDGKKYFGILYSAPDNKEDKYIILEEPHLIADDERIPLDPVEKIAIRVADISEIEGYYGDI